MNPLYKNLLTLAMAMMVLLLIFSMWGSGAQRGTEKLIYSELKQRISDGQVESLTFRGQTIEGVDESQAVNLELAPGQVALFDYRLAHASHANTSNDRRIGIGTRYIPPTARRVLNDWDSASLVRGTDTHGHFELEPEPGCDFDPATVALHQKSDQAQRKVYYAGARAAAGS